MFTIKNICKNPLKSYVNLAKRIEKHGHVASFPEFKYMINKIYQSIPKSNLILRNELFSLNYKIVTSGKNYPHKAFHNLYSYAPSILAIKRAMEHFDNISRQKWSNISPLYHTDRYLYHFNQLFLPFSTGKDTEASTSIIYYPTLENLRILDFILTRSVPIAMVGVTFTPTFADGYFNTPLDYFIHDFNHGRRFKTYNDIYQKRTNSTVLEMCTTFDKIIQEKIVPEIKRSNKMTSNEIKIRQALELLYFELLHEYAFTPDTESIQSAFMFKPGSKSPFEKMGMEPQKILYTGNIISGYEYYHSKASTRKQPIINYYFENGPHFIASTFNKYVSGYYDIGPVNKENPELPLVCFILAAQRMIKIHNLTPMTLDKLYNLGKICDPIEKYPQYLENGRINKKLVPEYLY